MIVYRVGIMSDEAIKRVNEVFHAPAGITDKYDIIILDGAEYSKVEIYE